MKKKSLEPTITDVARRADVSIATVSRVLNDRRRVRPATVQRVMDAMTQLNYRRPDESSAGRGQLAVIVLPNLDNPFYAKIIKGFRASAKSHGLETIIYPQSNVDAHAAELLALLNMVHASGLVLLSPVADENVLKKLAAAAPLVQCAEYSARGAYPVVYVDDSSAAQNAVNTLLQRGRRRIAIINGPEKFMYARQRHLGYAAALKDAGLPLDPALIFHVTEMGYDSALAVARQLLLAPKPPDAVLATSDVFAAAVVKVASAEGVQIPQALSLISFDNTFISQICHPSVAAVNMPQFQLGYMACEVLSERMQNPSGEPQRFRLNTELVLRDSI